MSLLARARARAKAVAFEAPVVEMKGRFRIVSLHAHFAGERHTSRLKAAFTFVDGTVFVDAGARDRLRVPSPPDGVHDEYAMGGPEDAGPPADPLPRERHDPGPGGPESVAAAARP